MPRDLNQFPEEEIEDLIRGARFAHNEIGAFLDRLLNLPEEERIPRVTPERMEELMRDEEA